MSKEKPSPLSRTNKLTRGMRFSEGNGHPPPETDTERLTRIEDLMMKMQRVLDVQMQRMADMQVVIDRLNARP